MSVTMHVVESVYILSWKWVTWILVLSSISVSTFRDSSRYVEKNKVHIFIYIRYRKSLLLLENLKYTLLSPDVNENFRYLVFCVLCQIHSCHCTEMYSDVILNTNNHLSFSLSLVYLSSCHTNTREYSFIHDILNQCRLDVSCELQSSWQFGDTKLVHNEGLEKDFTSKR